MSEDNTWSEVLQQLRTTLDPDEYRRWLSASSQAGDSGDQISVWVPSAAEARHISLHYLDHILRALARLGRENVAVRFLAAGYDEDEEEYDA
jgi:chromosomal replication initiation ATPase DnaA